MYVEMLTEYCKQKIIIMSITLKIKEMGLSVDNQCTEKQLIERYKTISKRNNAKYRARKKETGIRSLLE